MAYDGPMDDAEWLAFGAPEIDLGGHDWPTARRLVREGKGRWAMCRGAFSFVPADYRLQDFERFIRESPSGYNFEYE